MVAALLVKHGGLWVGRELIAAVATDIAANELASDAIGRLIEPWLAEPAPMPKAIACCRGRSSRW